MKSKNKKLFLKIYIPFVIITIIALIVLQILGSKNRIGYLTDFKLNVAKTLELNNLENFIIGDKSDEEKLSNYLLTNENITNYIYHFRIRYYDKVFRNNDIYGVYPDLSNLPDYIKNVEMDGDGSPYGNFISDNKEIEDKIDNINYTLKLKFQIINILFIFLVILVIIYAFNKIIYNFSTLINFALTNKNSKYLLVLLLLFFTLTLITEWNLFDNEISREQVVINPNYYIQTANYLNPFFLSNSYYSNFTYTYRNSDFIQGRRDIKNKFSIYLDVWSDNHILGNVYAALKTGKNIDELKSFNFDKIHFITNNQAFATKEDFEKPTLYFSVPHLTVRILYNLYPNTLRYMDSIYKELEASNYNNNIKKVIILMQILLWALLIYIIGIKFNVLYSTLLAIIIFCYPGSSIIYVNFYETILFFQIFPIFILLFYDKLNKIMFYLVIFALMFFQWNLIHWKSLYFQLPTILLTLCLCNFINQMKYENNKNIIINHIKKYAIQYLTIIFISVIFSTIVIKINYDEALTLQPEVKERLLNDIFERQKRGSKLSLIFLNDGDEVGSPQHFIDYSINNRVKHNLICFNRYLSYPIIYPTWRLEQYIPNSIKKLNLTSFHINLYVLLIIGILFNIFIFCKCIDIRNKLIIPNLFIFMVFIWGMIFINFDARSASHFHIFPHVILIVISCIFTIYNIYLFETLFKFLIKNINNKLFWNENEKS